jgi:hypothetical protein
MLGLLLGAVVGGIGAGALDFLLLFGPQGFFTWVIPGVGMSIVAVLSLGFTAPLAVATWLWPGLCIAGGAGLGGGIGFLTQLLGPNAVMDLVSGTMGACVVCMDSCLDCVSVMTGGILGPCLGMVGGVMGGGEGGGMMGMLGGGA